MRFHRSYAGNSWSKVFAADLLTAVVSTALATNLEAQSSASHLPRLPAPAEVIAFTNVAVIPMDRERVLTAQTVLVQNGLITVIGPASKVTVPSGAMRIDGQGRWLMPGLADMHAHWDLPATLLSYLAQGVTTVRMMGYSTAATRDKVARGELLGPRIYTAGSMVLELPTPETAERIVAEQKAGGNDFIKLHVTSIKSEIFDTFVAAAYRAKIPFAGHTPSVGLRRMLRAHPTSIEHLTGYLWYLMTQDTTALKQLQVSPPDLDTLLTYMDESKIPELAAMTKQAGVWNCPTLLLTHEYAGVRRVALYVEALDEARLSTRDTVMMTPKLRRLAALRGKMVKALHHAGAGLLLGTDMAGGVERELQSFVEAGLTPFQAIETSTRNVAAFLGTLDSTGTIAVGKRADLVLLTGNPLTDVRHVAHPVGVVLGGRWFSRAELVSRHIEAGGQVTPP